MVVVVVVVVFVYYYYYFIYLFIHFIQFVIDKLSSVFIGDTTDK